MAADAKEFVRQCLYSVESDAEELIPGGYVETIATGWCPVTSFIFIFSALALVVWLIPTACQKNPNLLTFL